MAQQGWPQQGSPGAMPPGYGPQGQYVPPAAVAPGGAYEFSQIENGTIQKTGSRARTWGVISMIVGVVVIAAGAAVMAMVPKEGLAIGGAVLALGIQPIASGGFYYSAGKAFKAVVDTNGSDIPLMMQAIRKLTHAVRIEAIASMIGFVLGIALGVFLVANS